jgi:uncharacterized protein YjbJ (UPF0337 family)
MWNKDEVKGKYEIAKGKIKQAIGHSSGDPELETAGELQELAGKLQESLGVTKRKVGNAVKQIGRKIKH